MPRQVPKPTVRSEEALGEVDEPRGGFAITWQQPAARSDAPDDCITRIAMFFPEFFRSEDV